MATSKGLGHGLVLEGLSVSTATATGTGNSSFEQLACPPFCYAAAAMKLPSYARMLAPLSSHPASLNE